MKSSIQLRRSWLHRVTMEDYKLRKENYNNIVSKKKRILFRGGFKPNKNLRFF